MIAKRSRSYALSPNSKGHILFATLLLLGICVLLLMVYSSVLSETIIYADEHDKFHGSLKRQTSILEAAEGGLKRLGRPFSVAAYEVFQRIVGDGWHGLIWVRALSLLLAAVFILTISVILGLAWHSRGVAVATAVFLTGNQCIQVTAFFSMLSPYMVGSAAAAVAAAVVMLAPGRRGMSWVGCGMAFLLLQFSWFVYQAAPFIAAPVTAGIALSTLTRERRPVIRRHIVMCTMLIVTMIIFVLIYRLVGQIKYQKANRAVDLLDSFLRGDIGGLLAVIKFNRIVETAYLTDLFGVAAHSDTKNFLDVFAILAILGLLTCLTIFVWRHLRMHLARSVLSISLSLALLVSAFIPLAADGFSERQQLWVPATLAWWVTVIAVFHLAKALHLLTLNEVIKQFAIAVMVVLAFGHLGVAAWTTKTKVADPYGKLAAYMEQYFREFSGKSIDTLKIVYPDRDRIETCAARPCIGFYQRGPIEARKRFERPTGPRQFARRAGVADGPREVVIVEPDQADASTLRLDLFAYENFGVGRSSRLTPGRSAVRNGGG